MTQLQVCVVSRSHALYEGLADYVSAPSVEGMVGILPGRQPFLAAMIPGKIEIKRGEEVENIEVGPGFISVDRDHVTIVVDQVD